MTEKDFERALARLRDPARTERLSAACRVLWPQPVSWDAEKLEFTAAFDTTEDMGNPVGWLHGGVMAIIFDNGMGTLASITADGCMVPTVSLDINYLRPAPLVGRVYMKARVLKPGRSLIHTTAELFCEEECRTPFASATAVYAILRDTKV